MMKIYICCEWSEEHCDIKKIFTIEEDANQWEKDNPQRGCIHYGVDAYEQENVEFIEVKNETKHS